MRVWLFRITVNLWKDRLRRRRRTPRSSVLEIDQADDGSASLPAKIVQKEDLQQTIDAALVNCNLQVEVPSSMFETAEHELRRSTQRRLIGVASMAALLVMACVIAARSRIVRQDVLSPVAHHTGPIIQTQTDAAQSERKTSEEARLVQVSFPANQDIIAAEFETDDPTVTVVLVYPTIRSSTVQD